MPIVAGKAVQEASRHRFRYGDILSAEAPLSTLETHLQVKREEIHRPEERFPAI